MATGKKKVMTAKAAKVNLEDLRAFVRQKAPDLMRSDPNITSVGVAFKEVGGKPTKELAIRFTVGEKASPQGLVAQGLGELPKTIDVNGIAVPTDVVERSYRPGFTTVELAPREERKARAEVLKPGISVGGVLAARGTGTIGAFVRDRTTGNLVLLSNWHVLQGLQGAIGNAVVQPGPDDDNRVEQNRIGVLLRSHIGQVGDCAVCSIEGRGVDNDILGLGVAVGAVGDPSLGDAVVKSGRTTGVTRGRVSVLEHLVNIDYGDGTPKMIAGFEIEIDPAERPADGEISKGGDSGSAWMAVDGNGKPTHVMLGLHFAGVDSAAREFAVACFAASVFTKLELEPVGTVSPQTLIALEAQAVADATLGYDRGFLSFEVKAPTFARSRLDDLAEFEGSVELRYRHFSSWLSKSRKYPLCVAWNIDGSALKRVNGSSFRVDRRGDLEAHQLTNAIYTNNPFDRGHVARRADLCWGSPSEARDANRDSHFHTNIVPQHEAFNQSGDRRDDAEGGTWGRLENTILDSENPHRLRISVMAGPVFGRHDRRFEQNGESCLLPDEFWKVVLYTDDADGSERAYGFLLTQRHLLPQGLLPQGLDFEPWLWARIALNDLQDRTGVCFGRDVLRREVPFVGQQSLDGSDRLMVLRSPRDYFKTS